MNLNQLIAAVYTDTNRPDLVNETLAAIVESTLDIHCSDSFYKDIVTGNVVFDQANFLQTLDTTSLPFYRSMNFVRKTAPIAGYYEQNPNILLPPMYTYPPTQFDFLSRIDPEQVLDPYGYEKVDVWYQAGAQINIKSSTALQYALVGWYAYPNVDTSNNGANFNSWIANEYPYIIIDKACGKIFAKIGEDKSWMMYMDPAKGSFWQKLQILKQNNIIAQG